MQSVCVLLYGDHDELALRVLQSLLAAPEDSVQDVRIGLNAVSERSKMLVMSLCERWHLPCYVYEPDHNVGKYPLMRRMFYDAARPLAERVMWFDDDSYVAGVQPDWFHQAEQELGQRAIIGVPHYIRPRGNQLAAVAVQPWYTRAWVGNPKQFHFVTGGWWLADTRFLLQHNYPFPQLHHNGGDSILGALCYQQEREIGLFSRAVCHCPSDNCQQRVRQLAGTGIVGTVHVNHAERRGIGARRVEEIYIWQNWQPGVAEDLLTHHNFECRVYSFTS